MLSLQIAENGYQILWYYQHFQLFTAPTTKFASQHPSESSATSLKFYFATRCIFPSISMYAFAGTNTCRALVTSSRPYEESLPLQESTSLPDHCPTLFTTPFPHRNEMQILGLQMLLSQNTT